MGELAAMVVGYSMMSRNLEGTLQFAEEENIGTMIASPLASGVLTGRWFDEYPDFPSYDSRYNGFKDKNKTMKAFRKLSELRFLTENGKRTVAQAALRFILDTGGVTSVIPGALRPAEIEEDAGAADVPPLTPEERERAVKIADEASRIWKG